MESLPTQTAEDRIFKYLVLMIGNLHKNKPSIIRCVERKEYDEIKRMMNPDLLNTLQDKYLLDKEMLYTSDIEDSILCKIPDNKRNYYIQTLHYLRELRQLVIDPKAILLNDFYLNLIVKSEGLLNYVSTAIEVDHEINYIHPEIIEGDNQYEDVFNYVDHLPVDNIKVPIQSIRKPCRLKTPLFKMNKDLVRIYTNILSNQEFKFKTNLRDYCIRNIKRHAHFCKNFIKSNTHRTTVLYQMNDLEKLVLRKHEQKPEHEYDLETVKQIVKELIKIDLSSIDNFNNKELSKVDEWEFETDYIGNYTLLTYIIKLRQTCYNPEIFIDNSKSLKSYNLDKDELRVTGDGFIVMNLYNLNLYLIIGHGFVTLYDSYKEFYYLMDDSHFDYLITMVEIKLNIQLAIATDDYKEIRLALIHISDMMTSNVDYSIKVDFMKNFESLCLMRTELSAMHINWKPIISVLDGIKYNKDIVYKVLSYIYGNIFTDSELKKNDPMHLLLSELNQLSPENSISLSTCHKFIYYSEVDEDLGIKKYLKRTFTRREFNDKALHDLQMIFRKLFIKNYFKVYGSLPNIICERPIRDKINNYLLLEDTILYDNLELNYFSQIKFGKTFNLEFDKNALLYVKDKASSPKFLTFKSDSASEMMDVISTAYYEMSEDILKCKENKSQVIKYEYPLKERKEFDFPVKLCMKEREQKIEGRLFGTATSNRKHELSYLNKGIENIVRLFDGQMISIEESNKREKMHECAQYLNSSNIYSLMLDIEGHNQSIQPENMLPILEDISDLYGKEDYKNLSYYFTNLDIYYNYHYINKTIYSKGQRGSIEGWMNPYWTLLTLLVTELLKDVLDIKSIMVYSDDVNVIFEYRKLNNDTINEIYDKIKKHYIKFGFNVKPSQTIISKSRSTLLRTHYIDGKKCEISLKKILSISNMTEDLLINEMNDVTGLNGGVNSAIEYTNRLKTILIIKWFRIFLATHKTFNHFIYRSRIHAFYLKDHISQEVNNLIFNYIEFSDLNLSEEAIEATKLSLFNRFNVNNIEDLSIKIHDHELHKTYFKQNYTNLVRAISQDKFLLYLYYLRIVSPESLGGLNVSTASNNLLTGVSNNKLRRFDEIKMVVESSNLSPEQKYVISNLYASKLIDDDIQIRETRLIIDEFPIFKQHETTESLLNNGLERLIKSLSRNKEFLKYLKSAKVREAHREFLIKMMRENFSYRIANYYDESTIFSILDTLFTKIVSSRNFIRRLKLPKHIFLKLYRSNTENIRYFFKMSNNTYDYIFKHDINEYFYNVRSNLYKMIKFNDIIEMSYINMVKIAEYDYAELRCTKTKQYMIVDDNIVMKHEKVPIGLKVKNLDEEKFRDTKSMIGRLILKNVYVTKWLTDHSIFNDINKLNYVIICNENIRMMNQNYTYSDIEHNFHLPSGGEIMHRLDNMRFKAKSFIKSLHSLTTTYVVNDIESRDFRTIYKDSNINFGFINNLLRLRSSIRDYLNDSTEVETYHVIEKSNRIIRNVREVFGYEIKGINVKTNIEPIIVNKIDMSWLKLEDEYLNDKKLINIFITNKTVRDEIITFYHTIRSDYVWYDMELSGTEMWKKLKDIFDKNYRSCKQLSDSEFMKLVRKHIRDYHKLLTKNYIKNYPDILEIINEEVKLVTKKQMKHQYQEYVKLESKIMLMLNDKYNYKELKELINDHNKVINKIIENLVIEFTIYNLIKLKPDKERSGNILIDTRETLNNVKEIFYNGSFGLLDTKFAILFNLLGYNLIKNHIKVIIPKIANRFNKLNHRLTINSYKTLPVKIENKAECITDKNLFNLIKYSIEYREVKLDKAITRIPKVILNLIDNNRVYGLVTGHANSITSYTYSDSYVAGVGLGNWIKANIPRGSTICDITAGRGDIHLALNDHGICHKSFSNKDFYTLYYRNDEINMEYKYDLTDIRTLDFSFAYDIIIIDISFIKGKREQIVETIRNYVISDKWLIIRINSLGTDILQKIMNLPDTDQSILIANSRSYKPYQVYLSVKKGNMNSNMLLSKSNSFSKLIEYSKNFFRIDESAFEYANRYIKPSLLTYYDFENMSLNSIILNFKDYVKDNKILRYLNHYYAIKNQMDIFILDKNKLIIAYRAIPKEFIIRDEKMIEMNALFNEELISLENRLIKVQLNRENNSLETKKELIKELPKFTFGLKYNELNKEQLKIVRDKLISSNNKLTNLVDDLLFILNYFDLESMKQLDDHMVLKEMRKFKIKLGDFKLEEKLVKYGSLLLIIRNLAKDNYQFVINQLINALYKSSNKRKKKFIVNLIKHMKILTVKRDMILDRFGDEIELNENYLESFHQNIMYNLTMNIDDKYGNNYYKHYKKFDREKEKFVSKELYDLCDQTEKLDKEFQDKDFTNCEGTFSKEFMEQLCKSLLGNNLEMNLDFKNDNPDMKLELDVKVKESVEEFNFTGLMTTAFDDMDSDELNALIDEDMDDDWE